jgi:hypothetical protein
MPAFPGFTYTLLYTKLLRRIRRVLSSILVLVAGNPVLFLITFLRMEE